MVKYHEMISARKTAQNQPIFGRESEMVKNLAGGYSFPVTNWTRLERFLILGSEGGTYYAGARELTIANAKSIRSCLAEDSKRAVDTIVRISTTGRAAKNDPAILALAMASSPQYNPDAGDRGYALMALPMVCRTGTHLFTFVMYINELRGWGRQLRDAVSMWYMEKEPASLAYQMAKYQQRGGWSHHDVMHLAHPRPTNPIHNLLFRWAKNGWNEEEMSGIESLRQLEGMERAKHAETAKEIIGLVDTYHLTREMVPNRWFGEASVWEAMLDNMPMTAMVRSLGKMSQVGLLTPMSKAAMLVGSRLRDEAHVKKARVHPWNILNAQHTYSSGSGGRGKLSWIPVQTVIDALDEAFELSFANVVPTGKRILIALDVSGSMRRNFINDGTNLPLASRISTAEAAGAMALITARTEPNYHIVLFNTEAREAHISAKSSLRQVVSNLRQQINGGTSYQAPINYANKLGWELDAFVIYGDEESWHGGMHASQAVVQYRKDMNILAKLVVNNFCANGTSVTDPKDAGMANFVGMDVQTPRLISEFIRD